jgi:hypothetical protein
MKWLIEEVKASMTDVDDLKAWMDAIDDKFIRISDAKKPKIEASHDMAWLQKGSGHVCLDMELSSADTLGRSLLLL